MNKADSTLIKSIGQTFREMDKVYDAVEIAIDYGQYDGAHHKQWVIDQMLRKLLDDKYYEVIEKVPDWDTGIAP